MTRQSASLALAIPPRATGAPAAAWLYGALRAAILDGTMRPGARLPATRDLARDHGVSRGTAVAAFEQLRAEGYVESRVGSGTFVAWVLPDRLLEAGRRGRALPSGGPRQRRELSAYGRRVQRFDNLEPGPVRAFRANQPALDCFPIMLWAKVMGRRLRGATTDLLLASGPMGYPPLQQAVADYLAASRGVRCTAGQVAILSGVQAGLDLAARLLLDPGDTVGMEDPGYPGARLVFEALGARVRPIRVDDEGLHVSGAGLKRARLVYVTPAHQFPLGAGMSLPRRLALIAWAQRAGASIVEDDYDSEYRYRGRPVPALQGLDRHGQVLFAGSFSKVLFPALRLGYLVVPADLVDRVSAALSVTHRHAPVLEQAALADFMAGGHFGRHVRRMHQIYAERLGVLLHEAGEHLAAWMEISPIEAGLQTVGWLRRGLTGDAVARAAAERDVEVTPLSRYGGGARAREGLVLGFAAVDAREIRRGVRALAAALAAASG